DPKGNLYGITTSGGAEMLCNAPYGCGTVFKIAPDGTQTVLHRFLGWNHGEGGMPMSALVPGSGRDSDYLYRTTSLGGPSQAGGQGCGVIFKIKKWSRRRGGGAGRFIPRPAPFAVACARGAPSARGDAGLDRRVHMGAARVELAGDGVVVPLQRLDIGVRI